MIKDKNGGIKTDHAPGQWGNTDANCRYTVLPDITKPEGEVREVKGDSFKNSWISEQHLQHLSQTHPGMSENPPHIPQMVPSSSDNVSLPSRSSQMNIFNSPQTSLEMNNFYFSQQQWESGITHDQQTQFMCESSSGQLTKTHVQLTESGPQQPTFSHQDQKHTLSAQLGNTPAGNSSTAVRSTLESHKSPNLLPPDVKTSSSTHHCQVSHSPQGCRATPGWMGFTHNMLDNNTGLQLKPFTQQEPEQESTDQTPSDSTMHSSNSGRPDITNKYQPLFLAPQLHGCQPVECLTSEVKPVQSCQDYTEDTSSSDDEGKLIIEL